MTCLHQVWRRLYRTPGYTLSLIVSWTIALTALLLVCHADRQLTAPLPYSQPEQLHLLQRSRDGVSTLRWALADWRDIQAQTTWVSDAAAMAERRSSVQWGNALAIETEMLAVSANYFSLLGVPLGDSGDGQDAAVVLSHQAAMAILGTTDLPATAALRVDGVLHKVLGVLPRDHVDPIGRPWLYQIQPPWFSKDRREDLDVSVLIRSSVNTQLLQDGLGALAMAWQRRHPSTHQGSTPRVQSLRHVVLDPVENELRPMWIAAALLLALVCANSMALTRARLIRRQSDLLTQAALGQSTLRRWLELLLEIGLPMTLGLGLAWLTASLLMHEFHAVVEAWTVRPLDRWPGLWPTAMMTVVAAVIVLLQAALSQRQADTLAGAKPSASDQRSRGLGRSHGWLLTGQCALAIVLLSVGLTLVQSALELSRTGLGFDTERVWHSRLALSHEHLPQHAEQLAFVDRLFGQLAEMPGIEKYALASQLPLDGASTGAFVGPALGPEPSAATAPLAQVRAVTEDYFGALGIKILEGRGIQSGDDRSAPAIAVIDRRLADQLFEGRSALNQDISFEGSTRRVVGVVETYRDRSLTEGGRWTVHVPLAQESAPWRRRGLSLVVRTTDADRFDQQALKNVLQAFDDQAIVGQVQSLQQLVDTQLKRPHWRASGFTLISILAIIVAAYGVGCIASLLLSYRTGEFAICRALGAQHRHIVRRASGWMIRRVGTGLFLGALAVTGLMPTTLTMIPGHVQPTWWPILGAVGLTAIASLMALLHPLRRALAVPPGAALRND